MPPVTGKGQDQQAPNPGQPETRAWRKNPKCGRKAAEAWRSGVQAEWLRRAPGRRLLLRPVQVSRETRRGARVAANSQWGWRPSCVHPALDKRVSCPLSFLHSRCKGWPGPGPEGWRNPSGEADSGAGNGWRRGIESIPYLSKTLSHFVLREGSVLHTVALLQVLRFTKGVLDWIIRGVALIGEQPKLRTHINKQENPAIGHQGGAEDGVIPRGARGRNQ